MGTVSASTPNFRKPSAGEAVSNRVFGFLVGLRLGVFLQLPSAGSVTQERASVLDLPFFVHQDRAIS